jgi:hypothetical protein
MRALRLDYCATRRTRSVGAILLLIGALLASVALFEYRAVREELSMQQMKIAEIRQSAKRTATGERGAPGDVAAAAQELKAAHQALQRLSFRWEDLFNALESAPADGVALLAVEPDPAKGLVKITAEARSAEDMLEYVERLQKADRLADVMLANHQLKTSDPLQPMRFVVVASWIRQ